MFSFCILPSICTNKYWKIINFKLKLTEEGEDKVWVDIHLKNNCFTKIFVALSRFQVLTIFYFSEIAKKGIKLRRRSRKITIIPQAKIYLPHFNFIYLRHSTLYKLLLLFYRSAEDLVQLLYLSSLEIIFSNFAWRQPKRKQVKLSFQINLLSPQQENPENSDFWP